MKEITLFLASSYELEPDRARIGNLLRQLNDDIYEKKHIHFKLVKWEDLNSFYNPSGKQNEYDFQIENCDLFVGLFWHSAGRHTKHEIEVARKHLLPGTILIFNKTAEVTPDHEGSEDEKRFLERHPEEKLEESREEFNAYLAEQNSVPYKDFTELSGFLTEKLAEYTENIEISENEKQRTYSRDALQIHIVSSPEAESDFARLGDLVRYLDENSKHYCRIKLINDLPASKMFVALCHTSAPAPVQEEIQTAIDYQKQNDGVPNLYFSFKHVEDDDKEESLKQLEANFKNILQHYPDRYYQAPEMKLHFLFQLEQLKRQSNMLVVRNGVIYHRISENDLMPLISCEDMPSLQKDEGYQTLKEKYAEIETKIEELKKAPANPGENDAEFRRLYTERADIEMRLNDKLSGYLRVARTLAEMVGKEQDENLNRIREMINCGQIDAALKLLPGADALSEEIEADERRTKAEYLGRYHTALLRIDCLYADGFLNNRDEIFKLYELLIHKITPKLEDDEKVANACLNYGNCLQNVALFDRALKYYEQALEICRKMLGENHPDTADCYGNIGLVWDYKGNYDKALKFYELALEIHRKTLGEKHPNTATSYNNIGNAWANKGEYNQALKYHNKALAISRRTQGEDHPNTAGSYLNIGNVWIKKGYCDQALIYYDKALKIHQKVLGEDHPDTAACYNNIGNAWANKGEYNQALKYHNKALAISRRTQGEDHPKTAICYLNIGNVWKNDGYFDRALEYYNKALEIWQKVLGEDHPKTAMCYNNIGYVLNAKGEYDQALIYYDKTLKIYQKVLGEDHPDTAACYNNIGNVWRNKRDFDRALDYHNKALKICRKLLGEEYPDTATCYFNIGNVWHNKRDFDRALEYYNKALDILKKVLGEEHPDIDIATCYLNIGNVWLGKGYCDQALTYCNKALEIRKKVLREGHPDTTTCYHSIVNVWHNKGNEWYKKRDFDQALTCYNNALEVSRKGLGENHPDTATCYDNIANVWYKKRDFDRALKGHDKALEIWQKVLGKDHPNTAMCYYYIGCVWYDKRDYDKALEYYNKALEICRKTLGENHPKTTACYNAIRLCAEVRKRTESN